MGTASATDPAVARPARTLTPPQVRALFEDMHAAGLRPSTASFNALLSAYAGMGRWADAAHVLQHMASLAPVRCPALAAPSHARWCFGWWVAVLLLGAACRPRKTMKPHAPHPIDPALSHCCACTCCARVRPTQGGGAGPSTSSFNTVLAAMRAALAHAATAGSGQQLQQGRRQQADAGSGGATLLGPAAAGSPAATMAMHALELFRQMQVRRSGCCSAACSKRHKRLARAWAFWEAG